MNQKEDYIFTFVSVGDTNGGSILSRRDFLSQHEDCWEELLKSGLSTYVCVRSGENLEPDRAITRLMAYKASLSTRQLLQDTLLEHYQLKHLAKDSGNEPRFESKVEKRFQQMREELRQRSLRARTA